MPESPSQRSNGTESLLPQGDNSGAPAQMTSSPVMMEGSVEAAAARPLPTTPPLESQGGGAYALVSPASGRYPAFPVRQHSATDPFENQVGERSSRSPSGGRSSRRVMSGVYDDGQHEADITDPAWHEGERVQAPGPISIPPNVGSGIKLIHQGMSKIERPTVGKRLDKTLKAAKAERDKHEREAKLLKWAVTAVTFAQLVSNALITGLSAATTNRHAQIGVSALGAMNTIMSSFLLRLQSKQEPERSTAHAKRLEKFCRELDAFIDDEGASCDPELDADIQRFRAEYEKIHSETQQSQSGKIVQKEGKSATATPAMSSATTPGPTAPGLVNPDRMV